MASEEELNSDELQDEAGPFSAAQAPSALRREDFREIQDAESDEEDIMLGDLHQEYDRQNGNMLI